MRLGEDREQGQPVVDLRTPIEVSNRGDEGVATFVQDQTTPVLTVPYLQERSTTTLAVDASIDDRTVTLTTGHGTVVGETLELAVTDGAVFMQSKVIAVATDVITLDQPVNYPYTAAGTTVIRSNENMVVDGSVTPQIFSVLPLPGQVGDIVRCIIEISGTAAMDFETFGSDLALTNGCVLRVKNQDGTFRNLFNFKSNGDFIKQSFDFQFLSAIANQDRSFTSRVTWGGQSKHGVVIRLDGDLAEELQLVVQDDLTGGDNFSIRLQAQGHETQ